MTGLEIREARLAAGVSQFDLARELELSQTMLSRIEEGKRDVPPGVPSRVKDTLLRITTERTQQVLAATSAA